MVLGAEVHSAFDFPLLGTIVDFAPASAGHASARWCVGVAEEQVRISPALRSAGITYLGGDRGC